MFVEKAFFMGIFLKWLYFIVGIAHLLMLYQENVEYTGITKGLLMPLLISLVLVEASLKLRKTLVILVALAFSWFGDLLLMQYKTISGEGYFILGLLSFLIAHVCYLFFFFKTQIQTRFYRRPPGNIILIFTALFVFGFYSILYPELGSLKIYVFLYMLVISSMALIVFSLRRFLKKGTFNILVLGAIMFMLSDALLAYNSFYKPISFASLYVMSSYMVAQFLLIFGGLRLLNPKFQNQF